MFERKVAQMQGAEKFATPQMGVFVQTLFSGIKHLIQQRLNPRVSVHIL